MAPCKAQTPGGKQIAGSSGKRAAARLARALASSPAAVSSLTWERREELRGRLSVLEGTRRGRKAWRRVRHLLELRQGLLFAQAAAVSAD
eukprot:2104776-Alexandrium_andersonii.AAC.1